MKKRKLLALSATAAMAVSSISAFSVSAQETSAEAAQGEFVLEYPQDMQELGFTEPLVLDEMPQRVVSLSTAPVLALYELGVNLVGVPTSSVVTWPSELQDNAQTVSFSAMSADDFDYESVVSLEPDLVFLAYNAAETAGETLESLGIPVYYVYAGHMVPYESIVMQTNALIDAFAVDEESKAAGEEIRQSFAQLEENVAQAKEAFAGKSVMILQSGGGAHYIQTAGATLGSMAEMIGLENVYENETSSMVQLDYEQALDYDPDLVLCVGATGAEEHKEMMEADFAANEAYWYSIPAIAQGNVIYLPASYVSTAGINIVDTINNLIGIAADFYEIEIPGMDSAEITQTWAVGSAVSAEAENVTAQ